MKFLIILSLTLLFSNNVSCKVPNKGRSPAGMSSILLEDDLSPNDFNSKEDMNKYIQDEEEKRYENIQLDIEDEDRELEDYDY